MIHRIGVLDAASRTERTIPVTGNPLSNSCLFAPVLGVAATSSFYRTRDFDGLHAAPWSRYAKQFRDDLDRIRKALTKTRPDPALPASHYQVVCLDPVVHFGVGPVPQSEHRVLGLVASRESLGQKSGWNFAENKAAG